MISFAKRNLLVFLRDKSSVFFSLLSSFIILGLYVLFLGDVYAADFGEVNNARALMDSWVMAGLLAATSVTVTMGVFGIMVEDKSRRVIKDFYSSPISRKSLAGGYLVSSMAVGLLLTLLTLAFAEFYICINGGSLLGAAAVAKVLFYIVLAMISNSALTFFVASFFSSNNAYATASTVIGTIIGFLTGIYLPLGMLPEAVQWMIRLFPPSHAAALLRQAMMEEAMSAAFAGEAGQYAGYFKEYLGVTLSFGDTELGAAGSLAVLAGAALVFFCLAALNLSRKSRG